MLSCIVYNASYEVLSIINIQEAIVHVLDGKAVIMEAHPDREIRTVSTAFPAPAAIRLNYYVKTPRRWTDKSTLNKHNLYIRDGYTCQYCGRHRNDLHAKEYLTKDHILPRTRGGENTWENLVTACNTCNNRKDNRTPDEAGMRLLSEPRVPLQISQRARREASLHR